MTSPGSRGTAARVLLPLLLAATAAGQGACHRDGGASPEPAATASPTAAAVAPTPRPTATNQVGPLQPRRVVFHPRDPDRLLVVEARGHTAVWNVADLGHPVKEIDLVTHAADAAFAPDGVAVVTADRDGSVLCWDPLGERLWRTPLVAPGSLHAVAVAPATRRIAAGGDGGAIHLLAADGSTLASLEGHEGIVVSLAFSRDGRWLASEASDTLVLLWERSGDGGGFRLARTLRGPDDRYRRMLRNLIRLDVQWGWGESVAWSPRGDLLATANLDGTARVWKTDGTPHSPPFTDHRGQHVRAVAFTPDGDAVASVGFDGTIRLWSVQGAPLLDHPLARHGYVATSASFSADGERVATAGLDDQVRFSNLHGEPLATLPRGRMARPVAK